MKLENLICTNIETVAFDDQRVTFANSDMEVVLKLKNQALHHKFAKGDLLIKPAPKKTEPAAPKSGKKKTA